MKHNTKKVRFYAALMVLLTFGVPLPAQNLIKGQLFDAATHEPLVGANVSIKNSDSGAATGIDGSFELQYAGDFPVGLRISYIGYEPLEIIVDGQSELAISLVVSSSALNEIVVTARGRKDEAQEIPIPITVLGALQIENSMSFNVNRVKELVPSVQLYSSNPRNTTLNIRGLGSTFGLTNDGIDPGVGFYVDGVYYARAAAATIDFIDIEQIEVLRGPQGTLFGKNTTAGTFNITTRKPQFKPGGNFELSYGNYGFAQAKASITGPLSKDRLAARLSFTGTHRDGLIFNSATQKWVNTLDNFGLRSQFLFLPTDKVEIILTGDFTRQRPDGYAQIFAGVAPTLRADYRQFENIIKDLNYELPTRNPFDRIIDHDTPSRSAQDMGGVSVNTTISLGDATLTSITAWRFWNWDPSNDRDFTGLQGLRLSQAPSTHNQFSQEFRYAGRFNPAMSGVVGLFLFHQNLESAPYHTEEAGRDQWRFSQNTTSPLWETPGLLDGYGIKTTQAFHNSSGALFGQLDWSPSERFTLVPGIRINYDDKSVRFSRLTYGGLKTDDPALVAIKNSVYTNQIFQADVDRWNFSGQLSLSYKAGDRMRAFATYAAGFKPVGLNLGGLPSIAGAPALELAVIKPEKVSHIEVGLKTQPVKDAILNLTVYHTDIRDYQTLVQAPDLSVNRGYLSNAEHVRVRGIELEGNYRLRQAISLNGALSVADGKYVSFTNAPPPLEETGGETFKDISGGILPGISKWAATFGAESAMKRNVFNQVGEFFLAADVSYRSSFSSSPSPSKYLIIDGYALLNARLGFRAKEGLTIILWGRNLMDHKYFEQLLPGAGNAGHYAAVLGDQRTFGTTLRYNFRKVRA